MQREDLSMQDVNRAKEQPVYLRATAEEFDELGMPATADDYRTAADVIEQLLAALGLPAFDG